MQSRNNPSTTPDVPPNVPTSNTWDPVTISNVIFSAIMVFIGIIAIWQAHQAQRARHRASDEEEDIGIRLHSRASTLASNASNDSNNNDFNIPLSRASTVAIPPDGSNDSNDINVPPVRLSQPQPQPQP